MRRIAVKPALLACAALAAGACKDRPFNRTCDDEGGDRNVSRPELVANLSIGNTGWYSSPAVHDLDGDGSFEIVAPFYDIAVADSSGNLLHRLERGEHHEGRVYAPAVVADLEGDGVVEVTVAAGGGTVASYEWTGGRLAIKAGWEGASTCFGEADQCNENRSIAADDLDGDGDVEVVVSSSRTSAAPGYDGTNPHVFVFEHDGTIREGWPRYDTRTDVGRDLPGGEDAHCYGHSGYGSFGLNVGIGDMDDDDEREILVTYDNHHIQAFNPDGTTVLADPSYFTRRGGDCDGEPMSWGQFIRYYDPDVEHAHYHLHEGEWPGPGWTMWLQWTHSPPSIGDVDGDGLAEVVGVPNVEMDEPYHTYHFAFVVLEGDYAATGHRSARRLAGWERFPLSEEPLYNDDWYPPAVVPSPTLADIEGDGGLELLAPAPDGHVYAFGPGGDLLWRYDYSRGAPLMYASEVVVADLSRDGRPEIVFATYGERVGDGHLVILASHGVRLHQVSLPGQRDNGNGIGGAAAPTVADLDGDGDLEILVLTIDHGLDIFTVEGSGCSCVPPGAAGSGYCGLWPTGRGNYLRNGRAPGS
jgi:hypothetical protein